MPLPATSVAADLSLRKLAGLQAAAELDVDTVCLDCEDAVAVSQKDEARGTIVRLLGELDFGRSERAVRINPLSSGIAEEDLKALLSAPKMPDALVIPKACLKQCICRACTDCCGMLGCLEGMPIGSGK